MVLGGRYTYMRVLSMQGKIVWDILKRNRVYYADSTLSREQNDYSEDIKRLNGFVPIWCYYRPEINFYTIYDGELLDYLRMEMSLERRNCWDEFVMFELEVPKNEMTIGYTCNASAYAKILPVLRLDMVMAVYELHDANVENPYYKIITPIWVKANCASDIITSTVLDCEKETLRAEECVEDFLIGDSGKCLTCAKQVQYVRDNKHFCSLACLWEHMRKFIRTACKDGFSEEQAIEHYTRMCDCDFNKGIVKAVKKIKGNLAVTSNIQIMKGRELVKKFRVVSFQSEDVVSQLLSNGIHLADKELLREGSLCQEDINACSGNIPIWVFQHPCFRTTKVGYRQWCELLQTFRCEMSVDSLSGMYMIELLLDSQPTIGKAHNGTSIACVIDAIRLENVAAIYKIDKTKHWYFYEVTPIRIFAEDVLFKDCVSFNKKEYSEDDTVSVKLSDFWSAEDYYKDRDDIQMMKNFIEERNGWVKSELTTGGYRIPCGFYSITCDKTIRNLNGDPHCVTGANIHFKVYGEDVDTSWYYIVDAPRLSDDDYYFLHLCGERDLHFLAKTISDDNTPIGYTKDEVMKLLNNTDEEE